MSDETDKGWVACGVKLIGGAMVLAPIGAASYVAGVKDILLDLVFITVFTVWMFVALIFLCWGGGNELDE